MKNIFAGTAGWSIPGDFKEYFSEEGSHLERYAEKFNGVEINSSFYKYHKIGTYERWAGSVPKDFKFSVKLSKIATHEKKLKITAAELKEILEPMAGLGKKWGCLLVQLPPSLSFQKKEAATFFSRLRMNYKGPVALEPRHRSWAHDEAFQILQKHHISPVQADPDPFKDSPFYFNSDLIYYRLHGSPQLYKSDYAPEVLQGYESKMRKELKLKKTVWCIFDNTMYGFATKNAVTVAEALITRKKT